MTGQDLFTRLFLRAQHPFSIRCVRALLALQALWILLSRPDLPQISAWPAAFQQSLDPALRVRFGVLSGHATAESALLALLHLALITAAAGLLPRLSCFVAGLLLYHFAPFEELIAGVPHVFFGGLTVPTLGLLLLSFAEVPGPAAAPSSEWGWPVNLIRLLFAFNYLGAGLAKLRYSGLSWFTGDNVQRWLVENAAYTKAPLTGWVAAHPALCWTLALATLVLELSFPAAAFSRRAARVLAPLAAAFHLGISAALGFFFPSLPLLLLYVDWDALGRRRQARAEATP